MSTPTHPEPEAIPRFPNPPHHSQSIGDLDLCLTCFTPRGRFDQREHRCRCEPWDDAARSSTWGRSDLPRRIDLCNLCARNTMVSGSRWTWLACRTCLVVNWRLGRLLGSGGIGALPLGRHSLTNGVGLSGGGSGNAVDDFAALISAQVDVWSRLSDWRRAEAKRLFGEFDSQASLPMATWLEQFPSSDGASVDALCRFLRLDLPDHPHAGELSALRRAHQVALRTEGSS